MSKESIIEKILADADLQAKATIEEAEKQAAEIIQAAQFDCDNYMAKFTAEKNKMVAETASRAETVASIDAKKIILKAKSDLIDDIYNKALSKARALSKETCKKVILGMLDRAEDGDKVVVSKREQEIGVKMLVDSVAKKRNISLVLDKDPGDFDGGIILSSNGIDKNLTFEVEFDMIRSETESDIAKELFGKDV